MSKLIINVLILFFLMQFNIILCSTWKVFFIMDSSDELNDMAIKNITDMVRGVPGDSVEFLVQLHAYGQVALRYKVKNTGLIFLEEIVLSGNSKQDFIDAASWAFSTNDFDYVMLILSNHGWGILDPVFNPLSDKWQLTGAQRNNNLCSKYKHKGFMFNETSKTYLNNQDFEDALSIIKKRILDNRKIDIIAFDTCMGSMLEVAYQVEPYAKYLVGSQSCSLPDGFDYKALMYLLNKKFKPLQLAKGMVEVFNNYYGKNDKSGIYTHAALNLDCVYKVKNSLDLFVEKLLDLDDSLSIITQAHKESPRFCLWPMYTDLVSFSKVVKKYLNKLLLLPEFYKNKVKIINIIKAIKELCLYSKEFVVKRCGGHVAQKFAHGYAIYLPENIFSNEIDASYYKTNFAKQSLWLNLLKQIN